MTTAKKHPGVWFFCLFKLSFVQGLTTEGLLAEVRQRAPDWQHRDRRLLVTPMRSIKRMLKHDMEYVVVASIGRTRKQCWYT